MEGMLEYCSAMVGAIWILGEGIIGFNDKQAGRCMFVFYIFINKQILCIQNNKELFLRSI